MAFILSCYPLLGPVYSAGSNFVIDTTAATIADEIGQSRISTGIIENRTFHGPNKGTWSYSVASFNLSYSVAIGVFSSGKTVSVRGAHALSVTVQGNFTISTELDVSGQEVNFTSYDKPLFWLGGFVRVNKSCCTLGKQTVSLSAFTLRKLVSAVRVQWAFSSIDSEAALLLVSTGSNTGSPRFTDFPSLCACSESNLNKSDWLWSQSVVFTKPFRIGISLDLPRGRDSWC